MNKYSELPIGMVTDNALRDAVAALDGLRATVGAPCQAEALSVGIMAVKRVLSDRASARIADKVMLERLTGVKLDSK